MPDIYAAIPGGMPTGWLKQIDHLKKQVAELTQRVQKLERDRMSDLIASMVREDAKKAEDALSAELEASVMAAPIKRGPGRPRKNPQ